jgi:hypothetical protein
VRKHAIKRNIYKQLTRVYMGITWGALAAWDVVFFFAPAQKFRASQLQSWVGIFVEGRQVI